VTGVTVAPPEPPVPVVVDVVPGTAAEVLVLVSSDVQALRVATMARVTNFFM